MIDEDTKDLLNRIQRGISLYGNAGGLGGPQGHELVNELVGKFKRLSKEANKETTNKKLLKKNKRLKKRLKFYKTIMPSESEYGQAVGERCNRYDCDGIMLDTRKVRCDCNLQGCSHCGETSTLCPLCNRSFCDVKKADRPNGPLLSLLGEAWAKKPHLRLMQFLVYLLSTSNKDMFYITNNELLEALNKELNNE